MGHRYIGSKTRVLDEIINRIHELVPNKGSVVDLMSGTGTVSAALRKEGFKVIALDLMTYSYHHSKVALLLSKAPEFSNTQSFFLKDSKEKHNNYEKLLTALNSVKSEEGYFWKEFSPGGKPKNGSKPRKYFSTDNAKKIDGIRYWIKKLSQEKKINELEHSLLLHDLIMAANDIANISGTYGHYLSKLTGRANDMLLLKPTKFTIKSNSTGHKILQGYAEKLADTISADLCYIDPPYMKRQYAANYHILETLAREDCPEAIGVSGLRPWRDQYSDFCTKTKIKDAFNQIFTKMKCKKFLISYSIDGLLSIKDMVSFFSKYGLVDVRTFRNKRFKSNNSGREKDLEEYLIYLKLK